MKAYVVGGWVRDRLLEQAGRQLARSGDRDWVVVGSSAEEMQTLGFTPVGRDFPVFLHPRTAEQYALARTERKTGPGYRGFAVHADPSVTLEEDLQRRDLTINAMALDEDGQLIDPYQGQKDLRERVLRHVGPAFVEDPVRILRLARFAARFADFSIAPETMELARNMVRSGEADALVPERVWQEIALGLMEEQPSRMIEVLAQTGLFERLAPELTVSPQLLAALNRAAQRGASLSARFAVLCSANASRLALQAWLERLRADSESLQLARLLFELREALGNAPSAAEQAAVLERADALRRGVRFEQLLEAFEALQDADAQRWRAAAAAASAVDAGAIAAAVGPDPATIARAVADARRQAIAAARVDGGDQRA